MKYDVQKSIWFNKIGIVKVKTKFNGNKYYIGTGGGLNQNIDEQHIAKLGMPVHPEIMVEFFKKHKE